MPNTKKIAVDWSETGLTVYAIIMRKLDSYLLNDADGSFASAPADPYVSLTEHSTIKGRYEKSESRTSWNDGWYRAFIYKQSGGSPSPASDNLIGAGDMFIESDIETFINSKMKMAWILAIGEDSPGVTQVLNKIETLNIPDEVGDDIIAIKAQTDKMLFDVESNILTSNPFPEGTVLTDAGNSAQQILTDLTETTDDYWVGSYLKFTSGDLIHQVKKILNYDGINKVLTFYSIFTGTPQNGDTFKIVNE